MRGVCFLSIKAWVVTSRNTDSGGVTGRAGRAGGATFSCFIFPRKSLILERSSIIWSQKLVENIVDLTTIVYTLKIII